MQLTTLCFLLRGKEICLAMKKRGFGVGKWNGVGGKVQARESIEAAALRELKEEIGVESELLHLEKAGHIKFYFKENNGWNQHVHIFFIRKWAGEPQETDEMRPQWYDVNKLPFDRMWIDDPYWLPRVISGKKIVGKFHFIDKGDMIEKHEIKEV